MDAWLKNYLSIQKPIRIKATTKNISVSNALKVVRVNVGDIAMRL
ncbi:hypothetical protein J538_1185 [Acinetobacter sp. 272263]|nr:hypothetical protein J538_1185 [Acinetobacter sp. 272263]